MDAFLKENPNIRTVWTPEALTRMTVSTYNAAARHQTVINLRQARTLGATAAGSGAEHAQLQSQLAQQQQVRSPSQISLAVA